MKSNDLRLLCQHLSEKAPIVLNITNYVAMNMTANALLAVGASPIMSFYSEEMKDLVAISSAVCLNIGCLDNQLIEAARIAVHEADKTGKSWVLDPVGVSASHVRQELVDSLLAKCHPAVIRCNASEVLGIYAIMHHDNEAAVSHGVDTIQGLDDAKVVEAAMKVAEKYETVVSVSGATDYITDGKTVGRVMSGALVMPMVTAMGCTASAITAALVGIMPEEPLKAAHAAMEIMGLCGERAAIKCEGPGTFVPLFIDELSKIKQL